MELIRGQHNLRPRHRGCVATIGNFDGVHLGHRAILRRTLAAAMEWDLPVMVIVFEPQPREFFAPDTAPPRLMRLREKLPALAEQGVHRVLVVRFDRRLAALPARRFVETLLVDRLGVRYLEVGDDFRFGRGREGDVGLLQRLGAEYGFRVATTPSVYLDGDRVSSTRVRRALAGGELELAARLLGGPYTICGRVAHGDRLGRTLGFPTANLRLHRHATPLSGVYAVLLDGVAARPLPGVANLGRRPTLNGSRDQLEVHVFDFDADMYGRHVCVRFLHHLRGERRFESLDALRQQIVCDAGRARSYFAAAPGSLPPDLPPGRGGM